MRRVGDERSLAAALEEADKTFNSLLNWDYAMGAAYEKLLRSRPPAAAIREAGRAIRQAK